MAEPAAGPGAARSVSIRVRYFAAARAAAGTESETVTVRRGSTIAAVVHGLAERNAQLSMVLGRCSFLCDGIAVSADAANSRTIHAGLTLDVLPPFAGG